MYVYTFYRLDTYEYKKVCDTYFGTEEVYSMCFNVQIKQDIVIRQEKIILYSTIVD
jgi:hypothetical protein